MKPLLHVLVGKRWGHWCGWIHPALHVLAGPGTLNGCFRRDPSQPEDSRAAADPSRNLYVYMFVRVWTDLKLGSLWTSIGTGMFDWEDSISLEEHDWRLVLNSATIAAESFQKDQPNPWSSIWTITSLQATLLHLPSTHMAGWYKYRCIYEMVCIHTSTCLQPVYELHQRILKFT